MNVVDEEPFGELWEKEMSNWKKKDLILFLKHNLIDLQDTKQKLQQHGVSGKRPTQKEIHIKSIDAKNIRKQFGC
jgi:hypothetical protein